MSKMPPPKKISPSNMGISRAMAPHVAQGLAETKRLNMKPAPKVGAKPGPALTAQASTTFKKAVSPTATGPNVVAMRQGMANAAQAKVGVASKKMDKAMDKDTGDGKLFGAATNKYLSASNQSSKANANLRAATSGKPMPRMGGPTMGAQRTGMTQRDGENGAGTPPRKLPPQPIPKRLTPPKK